MVLKLSPAPLPFCVALSQSVHQYSCFYFAVLSTTFKKKSLKFYQWLSSADRVLTLNINIWLPLFWRTWSKAQGPDSAKSAGLVDGQWLQQLLVCSFRAKVPEKALPLFFPWIVKDSEKTVPTLRVFQKPSTLIPQIATHVVKMVAKGKVPQHLSYIWTHCNTSSKSSL